MGKIVLLFHKYVDFVAASLLLATIIRVLWPAGESLSRWFSRSCLQWLFWVQDNGTCCRQSSHFGVNTQDWMLLSFCLDQLLPAFEMIFLVTMLNTCCSGGIEHTLFYNSLIISSVFFAIVLNTLRLCGIEHTCFRVTKILATAEAQMEPLKAPYSTSSCSRWLGYKAGGGATMLLPHLFINSPLRSVQDYAISCTEC